MFVYDLTLLAGEFAGHVAGSVIISADATLTVRASPMFTTVVKGDRARMIGLCCAQEYVWKLAVKRNSRARYCICQASSSGIVLVCIEQGDAEPVARGS